MPGQTPARPRTGGEILSRRRCGPFEERSFHDDLTVHPGMRAADVVLDARFAERHALRLAFGQRAGRPLALLHRACVVRDIADISERYRGARLDARACRPVAVLDVPIADLDCVRSRSD